MKRVRNDDVSSSSSNNNNYNFEVDYNDHFETPLNAYEDILPFIESIATILNKSLDDIIVFDPYYCQGSMIKILKSLGIKTIINKNEDFYQMILDNKVPEYDIIITNPPYSGEHKQKLLNFLLSNIIKPFALLLPCYIATKNYWSTFINNNQIQSNNISFLYVLPPESYNYNHPEGTGKSIPPFYSTWFVGLKTDYLTITKKALITYYQKPKRNNEGELKKPPLLLDNVQTMVSRGFLQEKRPNPKQRKKNIKNNKKNNSNNTHSNSNTNDNSNTNSGSDNKKKNHDKEKETYNNINQSRKKKQNNHHRSNNHHKKKKNNNDSM